MVYTYTPTYYTSLQDSITSVCKNILPFSFKKKRLPAIAAAEQRLSKQQSDNLKWQQDSFHQILNLMGLCKEGIINDNEVSAFRNHLLETLIASSMDYEPPLILRDKLIFLQELLYAKCISEDEYHTSKRPLLQRLAVQGAEIEARDVIVGAKKDTSSSTEEEWSVIELTDDKSSSANQETSLLKKMSKELSAKAKKTRSPDKNDGKPKEKDDVCYRKCKSGLVMCSTENPFWNNDLNEKESESRKSVLAMESFPETVEKQSVARDKPKNKPFMKTLFGQEHSVEKEKAKPAKKGWGFHGFAKWNKIDSEQEKSLLSCVEKSQDEVSYSTKLVEDPVGEDPDTRQIKRKLHPDGAPTDYFVDKVVGENIKNELCRIRKELAAKNSNVHLSDEQIRAISTRLPTDKADLHKFFPKSWCDQYGEIVLEVVRNEFKEHMKETKKSRVKAAPDQEKLSENWATFDDDDENAHPNLFAAASEDHRINNKQHSSMYQGRFSLTNKSITTSTSIDKGFKYNPFFDM